MWTFSDESQKRITILPDKMTEENKNLVKEIFSQPNVQGCAGVSNASGSVTESSIIEELDQKEANEILVRSSPVEVS